MSNKIIIIILILLIIITSISYPKKINKDNQYVSNELRKHHTSLFTIIGYIEKYNNDIDNIDKNYIKSLLLISKEFETLKDSYINAYNKKTKKQNIDNIKNMTSLIDNYFNLYIESVSFIDEINYNSLDIIKNDFEKWSIWIENKYISNDKQGFTLFKMYTFDNMENSGLLDELELK